MVKLWSFQYGFSMATPKEPKTVDDAGLAALAKQCREATSKNRAQAARDLEVSRPAIFYAEEHPHKGFQLLRKRIIETFSDYRVDGPVYLVRKK